jgi:hypothetical protein
LKEGREAKEVKQLKEAAADSEKPVLVSVLISYHSTDLLSLMITESTAHCGRLPLHQSHSHPNHKPTNITTLSLNAENDIEASCLQSSKMMFLSL